MTLVHVGVRILTQSHCQRVAPYYALDPTELQLLADPETPPAFLALALACCSTDRFQRPTMVEILNRLREIEADVLQSSTDEPHIGSIKFLGTKGKKIDLRTAVHGAGPTRPANKRIPSFGMGISVGQAATTSQSTEPQYSVNDDALRPPGGTGPMRPGAQGGRGSFEDPSEDEEDEELEAILALNGVEIRDEPPQVPPNANDSEMSWRLTGWMQEYVDKIRPKGSQSQMSQQAGKSSIPLIPFVLPTVLFITTLYSSASSRCEYGIADRSGASPSTRGYRGE